jgi:hypothetical protein
MTAISFIQNSIERPSFKVKSTQTELLGIIIVGFCCSEFSAFSTVHHLFINFKKAPVRRDVLYSILIEYGEPVKLFRLIKMCLDETYNEVHTGKYFSDSFLSRMV